jgi:small redox-active disulfide protein 2
MIMEIKILGTGCAKCKQLEKVVREVITELDVNANVSKEEDIMKIMEYGIMHTPGLVINEKVVLAGRLPSSKEIEQFITQNQ